MSEACLRGQARGAPLQERANLLRMLGVPRLQLRGVAASDPGAVHECGAAFTTERLGKGRSVRMCVKEGCDFSRRPISTVA